MKSLFFVLLVVVTTEARQVCIPETTWKQDCNTCFCNSEGTGMGCTIMACPPTDLLNNPSIKLVTEKPSNEDGAVKLEKRSLSKRETETKQVCIPDSTWKEDCNSCFCNSDGTAAGCTLMLCPPKGLWTADNSIQLVTEKPSNEAEALKLEKRSLSKRETETRQVCIPGTTRKMDCNTCFCNSDGTAEGCTLMLCPPNDLFIDPAIKLIPAKPSNEGEALKLSKRSYSTRQSVYGRHCEPGTIVKHYCNTCVCNKLGRVGRCTKMFCDEEVYSEDGSYAISPNGIFKN